MIAHGNLKSGTVAAHRRAMSPLSARHTAALALSITSSLTACGALDGDLDPDRGDNAGACALPEYGDGVCQTDLACDAPDIDCFMFFEDAKQAGEWFSKFEEKLAKEEFRPPRKIVAETDPRVVRMRALLDRGWEAYKAVNPVGDLAKHRPELVVLEDPAINAFVAPDLESDRSAFTVMVLTGLLDQGASDETMLGLVMHELEHAVGLHLIGDVRARFLKFYVADYGEPFGFQQDDDPVVREHVQGWLQMAGEVGPFPHADLGGLPLGAGQLDQIFTQLILPHAAEAQCVEPIKELDKLRAELGMRVSPLDGALIGVDASIHQRADAVMASLRDTCLATVTASFIDVVAGIAGASVDDIKSSLTPEDLALVEGKHPIDAISGLALARRARMRDIEAAFENDTGLPWSAVRYFSIEEAADDSTIPVLHAGGLPADGGAGFLVEAVLDEATRKSCQELIEAGKTPPYGVDLTDDHHATCWRIDHIQRLAESGVLFDDETAAPNIPDETYSARPTKAAPRLPIPRRLSERVIY